MEPPSGCWASLVPHNARYERVDLSDDLCDVMIGRRVDDDVGPSTNCDLMVNVPWGYCSKRQFALKYIKHSGPEQRPAVQVCAYDTRKSTFLNGELLEQYCPTPLCACAANATHQPAGVPHDAPIISVFRPYYSACPSKMADDAVAYSVVLHASLLSPATSHPAAVATAGTAASATAGRAAAAQASTCKRRISGPPSPPPGSTKAQRVVSHPPSLAAAPFAAEALAAGLDPAAQVSAQSPPKAPAAAAAAAPMAPSPRAEQPPSGSPSGSHTLVMRGNAQTIRVWLGAGPSSNHDAWPKGQLKLFPEIGAKLGGGMVESASEASHIVLGANKDPSHILFGGERDSSASPVFHTENWLPLCSRQNQFSPDQHIHPRSVGPPPVESPQPASPRTPALEQAAPATKAFAASPTVSAPQPRSSPPCSGSASGRIDGRDHGSEHGSDSGSDHGSGDDRGDGDGFEEEAQCGGLAAVANRHGLTMKRVVYEQFDQLCEYYKKQGKQGGARAYHYMQARSLCEHLPDSFSLEQLLHKVHGVGPQTIKKLEEIWWRGSLRRVEALLADPTNQATKALCTVHGIGGTKAKQLIDEYKVTSVDALRKQMDRLPLTVLSEPSRSYLKHYEELQKPIPRDEITSIAAAIAKVALDVDKRICTETCGSYRRGKEMSHDVDILLWLSDDKHEDGHLTLLERVVPRLVEAGIITCDLNNSHKENSPSRTFTGLCRLNKSHMQRRLDLRVCLEREYPTAVLTFSSGMEFNRFFQRRANELKDPLKVSSLGVCHVKRVNGQLVQAGPFLHVESEEDVFRLVGCKYMPPELRRSKFDVIDALTGRPVFQTAEERLAGQQQCIDNPTEGGRVGALLAHSCA